MQADAEAGLAAAGHADDHGVRGQVFGVVENQFLEALRLRACRAPQVKGAQLLEILHEVSRSFRAGRL